MNLSRRRFLSLAGAGTAGAAAMTLPGCGKADSGAADLAPGAQLVPFFGEHQAGITTAAQDRLHFAAFDVTTESRPELIELLQRWTEAAAQMTAGQDVGEFGSMDGPYIAPPEDTGEAYGLSAARLTLTFGFGAGLFEDAAGNDRFGLRDRQPAALRTLPHFAGDNLDPSRGGGDLCIQACADDPQIAVHAIRNLARIAFGTASVRWSQLGFGRTSSTSDSQTTPRNLFGFKDGTANVTSEHEDLLSKFVWVDPDDDAKAAWLSGGSYLVARRISMRIETWDRTSLQEQEQVIGRDKRAGAPLSGGDEHAQPDFAVTGAGDTPMIGAAAHVRIAHPDHNGGSMILRRGYNFTDGTTGLGYLDAGLFFLAYTRNPDDHYIPLQTNLAANDSLSEYIQHTGSALFAIPAGTQAGSFIGSALFDGLAT
jgi:deferrochelatase/peroxidase EfeB